MTTKETHPTARGTPPEGKDKDAPEVDLGTIPRTIDQKERAPSKEVKRFKLRCTNYADLPFLYVLAKDEEEAKKHYGKTTGLDVMMERQGEKAPKPVYTVHELPD